MIRTLRRLTSTTNNFFLIWFVLFPILGSCFSFLFSRFLCCGQCFCHFFCWEKIGWIFRITCFPLLFFSFFMNFLHLLPFLLVMSWSSSTQIYSALSPFFQLLLKYQLWVSIWNLVPRSRSMSLYPSIVPLCPLSYFCKIVTSACNLSVIFVGVRRR